MPRQTIKLGDLKRMLKNPKFNDDMEVWCFSVCMVEGEEDVLHASVDVGRSVQLRDGRVVLWANGYSDYELAEAESEEHEGEESEEHEGEESEEKPE